MRVLKFILFIVSMLLMVIVANVMQFNKQKNSGEVSDISSINLASLILYEDGDVKSISTLNFNTKQETLSKLFDTDISNIQNIVLKKEIKIENISANLVVFFGMYRVEQITVLVEPDTTNNSNISKMINEIKSRVELNAPADIEEIDDEYGNVVANITTYIASKYTFIITEYIENNGTGFSIDLSSDVYSYE